MVDSAAAGGNIEEEEMTVNQGPSFVSTSRFKVKDEAVFSELCVQWGDDGVVTEHHEEGELIGMWFQHPAVTLDEIVQSGFVDGLGQHLEDGWAATVQLYPIGGARSGEANVIGVGSNGKWSRVPVGIIVGTPKELEGLGRYVPAPEDEPKRN
jgi:hypothetical protein